MNPSHLQSYGDLDDLDDLKFSDLEEDIIYAPSPNHRPDCPYEAPPIPIQLGTEQASTNRLYRK